MPAMLWVKMTIQSTPMYRLKNVGGGARTRSSSHTDYWLIMWFSRKVLEDFLIFNTFTLQWVMNVCCFSGDKEFFDNA